MRESHPIATTGAPLTEAKAVVILLHGRGAAAGSMFGLADVFERPEIAYCAPQAPGGSWYPHSFLAPLEHNEPFLSNSLAIVADTLTWLERLGFNSKRTALVGFSQGGCLALEFVARNPRRYGAVAGLSAGIIGPETSSRDSSGSLANTSIFLGCSDMDSHIPLRKVHESTRVLSALGGQVEECIYPRMGHEINDDEIDRVRSLLSALVAEP
ncbi:alpha/beta fold hydrolase [Phyllobacterium sp. YR531]|uniref:alpha/beta hydrolase n=1 Tax=Phyllobacterium sp. YR531 TaxID=1144343 RepID=UPI00026FC44B|nr:alpha/beta fold hydrolase [Phyllobacterium sp. YR531]EJM97848.1 putative esterase [Phyllobacterium sp. YR531]